jgi:hypothetical protein
MERQPSRTVPCPERVSSSLAQAVRHAATSWLIGIFRENAKKSAEAVCRAWKVTKIS